MKINLIIDGKYTECIWQGEGIFLEKKTIVCLLIVKLQCLWKKSQVSAKTNKLVLMSMPRDNHESRTYLSEGLPCELCPELASTWHDAVIAFVGKVQPYLALPHCSVELEVGSVAVVRKSGLGKNKG